MEPTTITPATVPHSLEAGTYLIRWHQQEGDLDLAAEESGHETYTLTSYN